jgi:hypothetical protein
MDIKLGNIVFNKSGPGLINFGAAVRMDGAGFVHSVGGTPSYAAADDNEGLSYSRRTQTSFLWGIRPSDVGFRNETVPSVTMAISLPVIFL